MSTPRWTIYCHIHIESGRRYVGLTKKTVKQRWNQHVYTATCLAEKGWSHFANAIRKYGPAAFEHEVLQICETLEEANAAEAYRIERLDTRNPKKGFNLMRGGEHKPHPIHVNPWNDPDFRRRNIESNRKTKATLAFKRKASKAAKKLWSDPVFREKVTAANREAYSDPAVRDRAVSAMKEAFACPESKEKRSCSSKAMWESEEYRARNAELWRDSDFRERCQTGLVRGAGINSSKTHCRNGHEYTEENTYVNPKGSRECRICARAHGRQSMKSASDRKKAQGYRYVKDPGSGTRRWICPVSENG